TDGGETRYPCVGQRQAERVPPRLADDGAGQGAAVLLAPGPRLAVEGLDRAAGFGKGCLRRQRRTERDGDPGRDPVREAPTGGRAEEAGGGAVDVDGNDRLAPPFGNPLEPSLERLKHPRAGDLAFREDADQGTGVERAARLAECLEDHLGPAAA